MKTSTPTNINPLKKHSLNTNFLAIDDADEIEEEIKTRQEEAINKSSDARRKSKVAPLFADLTASELSQHCKDCIKLSTENKINTKNAFSFFLIDVMAAMAKRKDSEINKNFQVAGCTLDASVKIYSYRVDAVHTEVMKMAGGVLKGEINDNCKKEDNLEECNDEVDVKTKLKKKRKKLTIVHPDTLNAKSEEDILMDTVPHQSFLKHKTDGNDLLIKIPKGSDDCVLYINSDYICGPVNDNKSVSSPDEGDYSDLKSMLKEVEISKNDRLCPMYSNFQFGKEDGAEEASDEEYSSRDKNGFEFDLNASVEEISIEAESPLPEMQTKRLQVPLGGYESDQEIQLRPAEQKPARDLPLKDLKNKITLNELEYSMFDEQVLKAWAGPSYWKIGLTKKVCNGGKENENSTKAAGTKSTRKIRQKAGAGLFDLSESLLVNYLASGDRTTLNRMTMINWNPLNVSLPKDCMYKTRNLLILYHLPDFFVAAEKAAEAKHIEEKGVSNGRSEGNEIEGMDMSDSRSEEENEEIGYRSNATQQLGFDEEKNEDEIGFENNEVWCEGNMVEIPEKVKKIPLSSYKRKKNVDIKYLKKCLWGMLTGSSESKVDRPMAFTDIMKTCASDLPNSLAPAVTAPQIFNALLHLTNEKILVLSQEKSDKSDFVVSQ